MKKRIFALLLAAIMVLPLMACGGAGGNAGAGGSGDGAIKLDGSWPAEKVKIGVAQFDSTGEQFIGIQEYFDYLSDYYNIEFIYSEDLTDADSELNFISDCAAAGCKAIMAYYNVSLDEAAKKAADYGMYYWGGFGGDMDAYNAVKDNPYYLGGYTLGDAEYNAGKYMAEAVIAQGSKKVVFCSGGAAFGVEMFVDRKAGFMDTIKAAQDAGNDIEVVYEIEGWPGTDAFVAGQTTAMGMDIDCIVSTFGVQMWFQLVLQSDKADSIKLVTIGEVNDTYEKFVNDGLVTCIIYDSWEVVFGNVIPMVLNAVDGKKFVNEDGSAPLVEVQRWSVTSKEAYNAIYDVHANGEWVITAEDMADLIIANNPDMTTEKFKEFYGEFSIDTVLGK